MFHNTVATTVLDVGSRADAPCTMGAQRPPVAADGDLAAAHHSLVARTALKLPKFSGTTQLEPYLAHFRLVEWHNGWGAGEAAVNGPDGGGWPNMRSLNGTPAGPYSGTWWGPDGGDPRPQGLVLGPSLLSVFAPNLHHT